MSSKERFQEPGPTFLDMSSAGKVHFKKLFQVCFAHSFRHVSSGVFSFANTGMCESIVKDSLSEELIKHASC